MQRLEDEAFGPPTRPDEADFPEPEGEAPSGNGVATETVTDEPEDLGSHEDATTLLPAEDVEEQVAEAPGTGLEEPTGAHVTDDVEEPEGEPVLGEPVEEPDVAHEEPAAEEHAIVEEEPVEEAPSSTDDATSFYDRGQEEGQDLDLELSLDEESAPEEPPAEAPALDQPEGARPLEPPIESLDTVEHPFPDEITEEPDSEPPPSDEHVVPEEPARDEAGEGEDDSGEKGEDVLADTPEFLKDQPEDDELWFEQGEPKDFDF